MFPCFKVQTDKQQLEKKEIKNSMINQDVETNAEKNKI